MSLGRPNVSFCAHHRYPPAIRNHFLQIADQIECHLGGRHVRSVVVFGSAARGELSYKVSSGGTIDLFSDYEFLIVSAGRIPAPRIEQLRDALHQNKSRWGITNPLFHIEFGLNSTLEFIVKPLFIRRIGTFELQQHKVILLGDDLFSYRVPIEITARNLDYGNTNGLILERLWWLLFHMPLSLISGQMSQSEEEVMNYLAARTALEILAVFLPNEGKSLSGYTRRVDHFVENYQEGSFFQPWFHDFISDCLAHKLDLRARHAFVDNYQHLIEGYLSLLRYLSSGGNPHPTSSEALPIVCEELLGTKVNLFPDPVYPAMRRLRRDLRAASALGIPSAISWAGAEKRRHALAFLLYTHGSLLHWLRWGSFPMEYLDEAAELLAWLTRDPELPVRLGLEETGDRGLELWRRLCNRFVNLMVVWRVAPRPQEGNVREILERVDWWQL